MKRDIIQQQAVKAVVDNNYCGFVFAATGVGKTKIVIDVLNDYKKSNSDAKFLWLVPRVRLRDHEVPQEITKWGSTVSNEDIDVCCYASIDKYNIDDYDIIVADECHHITERVYNYLVNSRLIGITATEPEEKDKVNMLNSLGKVVFRYTIDEAVKDSVVDNYEVYIILMDLDDSKKDILAGNKKKRFKVSEKKNYEYLDSSYMKTIYSLNSLNSRIKRVKDASEFKILNRQISINIANQRRFLQQRTEALYTYRSKIEASKKLLDLLYTEDDRLLILTQRISVADELHTYRYHSKNKSGLESFMKGETNRLSACNALDEGNNLGYLDSIFMHQVRSTERSLVQRIGRSIRLSSKDKARIYIMCYKDTQDEKWVDNAVKNITNIQKVELDDVLSGKIKIN